MLLLNEEALKAVPEAKRVSYLLQWLQNLPQVVRSTTKEELKSKQKKLVGQLHARLLASLGPPLRSALGQSLVAVYEVGDAFSLHETVSKCCEILRAKEDTASLSVNKLGAIEVLGSLYHRHGRMAGSSFPEVVQTLVKAMKSQECRSEILGALRRLLIGLGPSSSSTHKEVYKCIRNGLGDKSLPVRSAAAKCALELAQHSTFLYSQELDSISNSCLRTLEGSNYDVRCSVAKLLGSLLAMTQQPVPPNMKGKLKLHSLDDALLILSNGFVRGASGFLKVGGPELLKTGGASREVRVGVTQTYVVFLTEMGGVWVEKHLPVIAKHILDLVSHPKTIATHIDAVYSRRCVSFVLRSVFGKLLGESAQLVAARHLCRFICQNVASVRSGPEAIRSQEVKTEGEGPPSEGGQGASDRERERERQDRERERAVLQHMLICSVLEIGSLVYSLNTAALPLVAGDGTTVNALGAGDSRPPLLQAVSSVLLYPMVAARVAGAWCMHCVGLALPSQLTSLVDYCQTQLQRTWESPEAVSGYSYAIAALLGTARFSELGLPSSRVKEVYMLAEQLIASGTEKPDSQKLPAIQSGWALIGGCISLGSTHVRPILQDLVSTWRSTFPRSMRELTHEQDTGSLPSWMVTLETRAGALSAMGSFLKFCPELVTLDITRRLMLPLDSALAMLQSLPSLVKVHGVQLRAGGAMLRLRLYQTLALLPPAAYEGSLSTLLRELVTEFTLTDNLANTTTSLLRSMCHHDDSILMGSWLEETDHREVEEQLQQNSAAGSGALEHDPSSVFMTDGQGTALPGPLPLGVAVIDASITLFGRAFPAVSMKHRHQLLSHFRECIRQAKSARQQAIQINIFTAFLAALKNLVENKSVLGQQELLTDAYRLIVGALNSPEPMLRCAAGEALGRMSQVGGDATFVARIAQASFDTLHSARDAILRTGHSLVLGCLHRYVGGMGSGQHLQTSVGILHALAQDTSSPVVQVWALHALSLIADSGGPMFRSYVEPTLTLMLTLLAATPSSHIEVYQCLAKCLSALITTLGPELQDSSQAMTATRKTCLTCCVIVQDHPDAIVQSAAIGCLQQLQLFAPQYVTMATFVPRLRANLDSSHLLLRRAAANCLRQFTQREPKAIWSILSGTGEEGEGLESVVLSKLDIETDPKLREDLREILFSLLTSLAPEDPMKWLLLCNSVLSAMGQKSPQGEGGDFAGSAGEAEKEGDEEDDVAKFTSVEENPTLTRISPRWPTKVFAVECSRKVYAVCKSEPAHFDLALAQRQKRTKGGDYLVMHLSELVRTSFIAATASVDQLKLAGYLALRDVIEIFAATADPDFQGHVLLEQYQAQIGAALRPAFTPDTAPHVTAMACQVCSEWLGSGVSRVVSDLKRVQQLLVSSLEKLRKDRQATSVYGEAVATMESLSVLKAWSELYIKVSQYSMREPQMGGGGGGSEEEDVDSPAHAMDLLNPHLPTLSQYWLSALKDHAYLSLPSQFASQLPPSGGSFYTADMAERVRPYYEENWVSLLYAAAIWLKTTGFEKELVSQEVITSGSSVAVTQTPPLPSASTTTDLRHDHLNLVLGLAVQTLCVPATLDHPQVVLNCLRALQTLLRASFVQQEIASDPQLAIEVMDLVHRLLLTCQPLNLQLLVLEVATLVGAALLSGTGENGFKLEETVEPGKSCSYALLKVSACCLLRMVPDLMPSGPLAGMGVAQPAMPSQEEAEIMSQAVSLLVTAASLAAPSACVQFLPTLLHMLLSALKYSSTVQAPPPSPTHSILHSLKLLCSRLPLGDEVHGKELAECLRSALASVLGLRGEGEGPEEEGGLSQMSKETQLLVVALLLTVPADVCPPLSHLFDGSVQLFRHCFHDSKLHMKTLQACKLLLFGSKSNLSVHFIHALGPEVVRLVEDGVSGREKVEVGVVIEATKILESLLDQTPDEQKAQMMGLIVPLFVSALCDPAPSSKDQRSLHEHALAQLKTIGPRYPVPFKTVMLGSPLLRQRLEAAIRASQGPSKVPVSPTRSQTQARQAPAITLKMDFSNFK